MNEIAILDKKVILKSIENNYLSSFDEIEFLFFLKKYFNDKAINIIDCGSNIGSYSIFFSLFCNSNTIYSFEAHPEIFNVLKLNIEKNNCKNIICQNIGISNKKSVLNLISFIPNNKGAYWFWYKGEERITPYDSGYKDHKSIDNKTLFVNSDSIDNLVSDKIDFIKIDVEGMELEVLSGAKNTIKKHRPLIYVEGSIKTFRDLDVWILENKYNRLEKNLFKSHHYLLEPLNEDSSNR